MENPTDQLTCTLFREGPPDGRGSTVAMVFPSIRPSKTDIAITQATILGLCSQFIYPVLCLVIKLKIFDSSHVKLWESISEAREKETILLLEKLHNVKLKIPPQSSVKWLTPRRFFHEYVVLKDMTHSLGIFVVSSHEDKRGEVHADQ